MIDPEEELTAVLSDQAPFPVAPSNSSAHVLSMETSDIAGADDQVAVRQLGQGALFWRRLRRHKAALVGGVLLLLIITMAIVGPYVSPESYLGNNFLAMSLKPQWNWRYLMGTDLQGHSILMYILLGARASLEVGIFSGLIATSVGILIGAVAGYFGHFADAVMMRVTDVFLTLPFLPLLLILEAFLAHGGIGFIIVIFGVLGWTGVARLIRAYYLTFREQDFVAAAQAVGVSSTRIIFRHILPNSLSPIIVSFTLSVAGFITAEAAIDFLGFGLKAPDVSWGLALASGEAALNSGNWWATVFPGLALLCTVLAINFLGDGLRDALDVKAKVVE
jgi:peptide/nickel transport system permease protein